MQRCRRAGSRQWDRRRLLRAADVRRGRPRRTPPPPTAQSPRPGPRGFPCRKAPQNRPRAARSSRGRPRRAASLSHRYAQHAELRRRCISHRLRVPQRQREQHMHPLSRMRQNMSGLFPCRQYPTELPPSSIPPLPYRPDSRKHSCFVHGRKRRRPHAQGAPSFNSVKPSRGLLLRKSPGLVESSRSRRVSEPASNWRAARLACEF